MDDAIKKLEAFAEGAERTAANHRANAQRLELDAKEYREGAAVHESRAAEYRLAAQRLRETMQEKETEA